MGNLQSKFRLFFPLIIFSILWEILSVSVSSRYFPSFYSIAAFFFKSLFVDDRLVSSGIEPSFILNVWTSFIYYVPACLIGILIGIVSSLILFVHKTWLSILEPVFDFLRIIPPLIIAPFMLLAFKGHSDVKVIITFVYTALSICVYGLVSLQNVPKEYLESAKIFNVSKTNLITKILYPAMLPGIIGGIRVNIAMSLGVLMVSEYIGGNNGIGKVLKVVQGASEVKYSLVAIIWSVIMVSFLDAIVIKYLTWCTKWNSNKISVIK
jgi:ABC-type nitrate/sulfonate/bicarbonate transport system permease component